MGKFIFLIIDFFKNILSYSQSLYNHLHDKNTQKPKFITLIQRMLYILTKLHYSMFKKDSHYDFLAFREAL